MKRHRVRAVTLVVGLTALIALAAPSLAHASAVTQWNLNATNALIGTAGQAPPVSVMHLAMVHGAVYDAVNGIDRGYQPYLVAPAASPWDSKEAAVATAAFRVLVSIVPSQQTALQTLYDNFMLTIPAGSAKDAGIAAGEAAAAAMIAARTNDGRFGPFRFATGTDPGEWRPPLPPFTIDPNSWVKDVKPFMIESSSQFRSRGPYHLTSPQYAREFNEVKAIGSAASTTRTGDQTHAARYWAENPPATWSRIFRMLDEAHGLATADAARYYAMLYLTAADAFITIWDDKAHWSFWRPITAIREAATDGNPATEADPAWLPLIANPPYPEHPSGHLGLSGSFVETLQEFFRSDQTNWTDTNGAGLTRTYTRFSRALDEIVSARVWSGIHFRNADEQAVHIAKQIAKWRKHHYFKRMH
jgi:hypothetical protein